MDFAPNEIQKRRSALEDGEPFLRTTWEHPVGDVKKRCMKKKKELVAILKSVITRDRASAALYTHVFPVGVLVENFRRRVAQQAQSASPPRR